MSRTEAPHPAGAQAADDIDATMLNLGSGEDYREYAHNVDYNDRYNPDEVVDLRDPWPTAWHGEFEIVVGNHILEHLPDLDHVFREAARCLRPGGVFEIRVPLGINARTDWTHEHEFTYDTPLQFDQEWTEKTDDYQFDPTVPFTLQYRRVDMTVHGPLKALSPLVQRLADSRPGVWTSGVPCASGELLAVYRRCDP